MADEHGTPGGSTMLAARLHGPRDLRVERVPHPGPPGPGQALLRVTATGICGSDLHSYTDGRIGDTLVRSPLVLGHEFGGVVEAVGADAWDGLFQPLEPGTRVAVDPAQPCGRCELCEQGHPNLCRHLRFCSNYPDDGSLRQWMHVPARTCFPVPDSLDDAGLALLEPLGVAIHALDLARIRLGASVVILGAGPLGLYILQLARRAGAELCLISDKFSWRLEQAAALGGVPIACDQENVVQRVRQATDGRGVDVAIEVAWGEESVAQAAEVVRLGGRVVLVGIPSDDRLQMKASTARRKGLTIMMCRRMKLTYPRAIRLAQSPTFDLHGVISHRFELARAAEAFALNAAYQDNVIKVIIEV